MHICSLRIPVSVAAELALSTLSKTIPDPFGTSGLRIPNTPATRSWLHAFHAPSQASSSTPPPTTTTTTPNMVAYHGCLFPKDQVPIDFEEKKKKKRRNIVIVPASDSWTPSSPTPTENKTDPPELTQQDVMWMSHPNASTFDIVAIYHGPHPSNFSCPSCLAVIPLQGPKWRLMYEFPRRNPRLWARIVKEYEYVMIPDDDLQMSTCAINAVFYYMKKYQLLLAQPSVCSLHGAHATWRPELHQSPQWLLRYSTFVEVMAPTFEMRFYEDVVHQGTFPEHWTWVGWGLDSIWPAILHYPRRKIGLIDAVSMTHLQPNPALGNPLESSKIKQNSIYAPGLSPYTAKQEESIVFNAFNYTPTTTGALGEPFMGVRILGGVQNTNVLRAMAKSGMDALDGGDGDDVFIPYYHRLQLHYDGIRGLLLFVVFAAVGVLALTKKWGDKRRRRS